MVRDYTLAKEHINSCVLIIHGKKLYLRGIRKKYICSLCIFVSPQVTMVCQRMLKEREEQVCLEFGKILETKLAGMYTYA